MKATNGANASSAGAEAMKWTWLISSAPKLARDVRRIKAVFRSA